MGQGQKLPQASEKAAMVKLGKSIMAKKMIPVGTELEPEHIAFKSPATGMPPYKVYDVLGRTAQKDIATDEEIDLRHLSTEFKKKHEHVDWGSVYDK
jgi:sialic acid synthase SpsE